MLNWNTISKSRYLELKTRWFAELLVYQKNTFISRTVSRALIDANDDYDAFKKRIADFCSNFPVLPDYSFRIHLLKTPSCCSLCYLRADYAALEWKLCRHCAMFILTGASLDMLIDPHRRNGFGKKAITLAERDCLLCTVLSDICE